MSGVMAALAGCATAVACVALVGMTLVEAWQVYARYVLNDSPSWTEPVVLLLMSAAMMSSVAPGQIGWTCVRIALSMMSRWISGMAVVTSVAHWRGEGMALVGILSTQVWHERYCGAGTGAAAAWPAELGEPRVLFDAVDAITDS